MSKSACVREGPSHIATHQGARARVRALGAQPGREGLVAAHLGDVGREVAAEVLAVVERAAHVAQSDGDRPTELMTTMKGLGYKRLLSL